MRQEHSPEKKMSMARTQLLFAHPFYGHRLMKMKMVCTDQFRGKKLDTAVTDGKTIYYSPEFVSGLKMDEAKGLLAHEALHVMLCHHLRGAKRNPAIWNKATDVVINQNLEKAGFALPPGGIHEGFPFGDVSDKSAEWIYAQMMKMMPPPDPQSSRDKNQEAGDDEEESEEQEDNGGSTDPEEDGEDPDNGEEEQEQEGENPLEREGSWGEVAEPLDEEGRALSDSEIKAEETNERIAVSQAANYAGKSSGDIPAGLRKIIEDLLNPQLPWREILRQFVQTVSKNDYSWVRPNRRHIADGLYLPSLHSDELGDIAIALDTSGSTQPILHEFVAEMNDILSGRMRRALLIHCDCRVAHVEEITPMDLPFTVEMQGGGGTAFSPPFDWIEQQGEQPVALIYFTDGYGYDFAKEPPYPVLWVLDRDNKGFKPPYGDVIRIREE